MYINDRNFIKMAIVPYFLGTLALNGIALKGDDFFKMCKSFYLELCDKYLKDVRKINTRLDVLNAKIMEELVNRQNRELNTHKAIICINSFIQIAIDNCDYNEDFARDLISFLEPFQEIEARMKLDDKDWLALKESADKKAKKIYEIIFKNNT
jgi:hypothetical protein